MRRTPLPNSLFSLALLAALAVVAAPPAGSATASGGPGPLPAELAEILAAKARVYRNRTLLFTCTERVRRTTYREGRATENERWDEREYLFTRDESAPLGFRALRTRPGSRGKRAVRSRLAMPEPWFWPQVFSPAVRSTLRFRVGTWHTTPWKLAIPISWVSAGPTIDPSRITAWSGTIEVEYRTGNVVRVIARPNFQEERIQRELARWLTAFRFLGISTAAPPIGREIEVSWDHEKDGLTYPTRVELRTFVQVTPNRRWTREVQVVEYTDYRFFGTTVEEHVPPLTWTPGGS